MGPSEAVQAFLVAYDVPMREMPPGLPEQSALFRSVLAGKRALLVLDNAKNAEHVRHLLPGTAGCLVVVTSRDRLTPLVASEGAYSVALGPLSPEGARDLLIRRLGARRVAQTPAAL